MNKNNEKGKLIEFDKLSEKNRSTKLKNYSKNRDNVRRIISISSGKGGVGKTNVVANFGYAMCKMGKKVLIVDADFGLGNIDVLLGITPKYNLLHVITGKMNICEIITEGPGKMVILPASSGIDELTNLDKSQRYKILCELEELSNKFDVVLIDTAAGISKNVTYFSAVSQETVVVVSPEPTSITDAYALMKVLSLKYGHKYFKLLVNMVETIKEGERVYNQLKMVSDRFLEISMKYIGSVKSDLNVVKSVKAQKLFTQIYPETASSKCIEKISKNLMKNIPEKYSEGGKNFLWDNVVDKFNA